MEDEKNLKCTIEESSGIRGATCTESMVRNWRDLPLHSDSCKEDTYKSVDEVGATKIAHFVTNFCKFTVTLQEMELALANFISF
jgi:hypothetical protein